MAWFALHLAKALFTLAGALFNFRLVCPAFSPDQFTLAGVLFNFGSVALHLAQDLFTLARALFNFGLVCFAFSPGLVYFG